jgi:transposase
MENTNESLNTAHETQSLRKENAKLKERNAELEALIKFYEEQMRLAKHKQFGASSEKTENAEQLGLFDEAENTADPKAPEEIKLEEITYKRKKRIGKRVDDITGLQVDTIVYKLEDEECVCPECGENLHEMSTQERCEVEIIPATFVGKRHIQTIYSCRNCEKNNDRTPIIKASAPEPVIKNSLASPSAVAHIMVEKYVKAVPLYRQEQSLLRDGISLSRQTMANWVIRCAEDWLDPIYDRLKEALLKENNLHADETVVQVLREPGKKANTNSYEWLYRTSGCAEHPVVLYEYQPTRSSSHPKRFLAGWSGYLHTDGYQGYHVLPDVTVVGCFAHVRRKFDDALKSLSPEMRQGSSAEKGLEYCNRLFEFERMYAGFPTDERYRKRLENSVPVAEEFLAWAKTFADTPKSTLKTAADYLVSQWPYLKNVFLDGRLELSNNRAERSIKPFVIGRKNWLFSNTQRGARASSVVYSVIQTAIENGLNPFKYLKLLFETLPNCTTRQVAEMLPWSANVQDICSFKV